MATPAENSLVLPTPKLVNAFGALLEARQRLMYFGPATDKTKHVAAAQAALRTLNDALAPLLDAVDARERGGVVGAVPPGAPMDDPSSMMSPMVVAQAPKVAAEGIRKYGPKIYTWVKGIFGKAEAETSEALMHATAGEKAAVKAGETAAVKELGTRKALLGESKKLLGWGVGLLGLGLAIKTGGGAAAEGLKKLALPVLGIALAYVLFSSARGRGSHE